MVLGIGSNSIENPFTKIENLDPLSHFKFEKKEIFYDGVIIPTDPRLGVEGRPQSASGQTTILTGKNAPQILGFHKQGFPNAILREVITENSIFLQLKNKGIEKTIFANAYTPQFFQETPRWKSATTVAVEAAGLQFKRISDLLGQKSSFSRFYESGFDRTRF